MIKRIIKIKNFPSFFNFTPSRDLPDFSKYNLIYGWNGSGKTVFSRVLRSFELGRCYFEENSFCSEFGFKLSDNTIINQNDLSAFAQIRVFNKDFIEESIFCEGGTKPIFYLGKDSKESRKKIDKLESEIDSQKIDLKKYKSLLKKTKEKRDKERINKAKDIKTSLTTPGSELYRNYDRTDLEKSIRVNMKIIKKQAEKNLSDKRLASLKKSILQVSMDRIDNIDIPNFDISDIEKRIRDILSKSIVSQVLEELKSDEATSKWVEEGLSIDKRRELTTCSVCTNPITTKRFNALEKHFNDEYQNTLSIVKELKTECGNKKTQLSLPDSSRFYDDLVDEFLMYKDKASEEVSRFNTFIDTLSTLLDKKERNLFSTLNLEEFPLIDVSPFSKIDDIVNKHNSKTDNFDNQTNENKKQLEVYYLSEFLPSYISMSSECESLKKQVADSENAVQEREEILDSIKASLLSHHIPVQKINNDLKHFLGRDDIYLKTLGKNKGYQIIRNDNIAKDLSEGEKTALAIVYFLAKIKEDGFDFKNGVIVIDDPVSRLDSNAIFQAFSFIKEAIKNAGQIFILTHHFDFFRQVKGWFYHCNKNKGSFMVVCNLDSGKRNSSILKIDKLLISFESEYHFLFKVLYNFSKNNQQELEKLYPLPNIGRKFLESFLAFRIPLNIGNNIHERLKHINFDPIKKTRIEHFVQTHSHPMYESGIQDFDMTILCETPEIISDLLDLVKEEDEKHFNFLLQSIN